MIRIEYVLFETVGASEPQRLGLVIKEDLAESLLPWFKAGKHQVFINKHFRSHPEQLTWEVINIEADSTGFQVVLRPETGIPESYGKYFGRQNIRNPKKVIREFSVVDVDFGHKSSLIDTTPSLRDNEKYVNAVLPGELHKKRPCLVVAMNPHWKTAQVIPLTTRTPKESALAVEIPRTTFNNVSQRYSDKSSYALLDMITTVSWLRMYPLRDKTGKFSHATTVSVSSSSKADICNRLASSMYPSVTNELNNERRAKKQLNSQLSALRNANVRYKETEQQMDRFIRRMSEELFGVDPEGVSGEDLIAMLSGQLDSTEESV